MKSIHKISYIALLSAALLTGCNKDVLDRPEKTKIVDSDYWRNAGDVRLYANAFYTNYFVGYNSGFGVAYAPLRGYNFADDFSTESNQPSFEGAAPTARGSNSLTPDMLTTYSGPSWNFAWVRKANVMLDRIDNVAKPNLSEAEYKHWSAVGRFFRGFEYARLVGVFGSVPYFDAPVDPEDFATMYKDRDDRGLVMDKVYDDFEYVLANMLENDGAGYVNRYVAASFISNFMLFEGSWQHYHGLDAGRAKKYLELAVKASQYVIDSGKWNFGKDFKSLFASDNLATHPEVIFSRKYDDALKVTHAIASYSNGTEGQDRAANLNLLNAFICTDGKAWKQSGVAKADDFSLKSLVKTRDSRFEATFMDTVNTASKTLVYAHKFAGREALSYIGSAYPARWTSNTNTNSAPVVRLAEVVLNWIEAKEILAENFGGAAVTQNDLDKSINAIRKRPLDADAIKRGVSQTAPIQLASLPVDVARDADVSALMWEIRRERRMEFVYEHTRLNDIRRWKKLNYLNFVNTEYGMGPWINALKELAKDPGNPAKLAKSYEKVLKVRKADGSVVTYDGTNATAMVGYYMIPNFGNRVAFTNRAYLAPVGLNLVQQYKNLGYKLTQTPGWE